MQPVNKSAAAQQEIAQLQQQLAVTETVLLKVLKKVGSVEMTAEELAVAEPDSAVIDMDLNEETDVWTFTAKDEDAEA